jgi:hypothetical protein
MWTTVVSVVGTMLVVLAISVTDVDAAIIRVGPGGDFADIQPAIDAAVDGDVILVQPGTYTPFRLAKGVVIRSAAAGQRFNVQPDEVTPYVSVESISTVQKAGISGMKVLPVQVSPSTWEAYLWLRDCQGEVVLENVLIYMDTWGAHNRRLLIQSCANVAVVDLQVETWSYPNSTPRDEGTVQVFASQARISNSLIQAGTGFRQAAGIEVRDSTLILSTTDVFGGNGDSCVYGSTLDGGDGIIADNSQVMAIGSVDNLIEGGYGGSGYECGQGGEGGAGFRGYSALVSLVTVEGGKGGSNGPFSGYADDGPDWDGDLTRLDVIPYLTMTGDLQPGDSVDITLRTVEAGLAALAVSSETGFLVDKSKVGPPLSVIPGGLFLVLPIGHVDSDGTRVVTCTAPADPQLVGFRLHVQGAVVSSTTIYLTNALSRVLGE